MRNRKSPILSYWLRIFAVLILSISGFIGTALAESDAKSVDWNELTRSQQKVLQPFAKQWKKMPVEQQQRLLSGVKIWNGLNQQERVLVKKRFKQWRKLPPEQKKNIRNRFNRFLSLSPREQKNIRQRYRQFKKLPMEKRRALRKRWEGMSLQERKRVIRRITSGQSMKPPRQ